MFVNEWTNVKQLPAVKSLRKLFVVDEQRCWPLWRVTQLMALPVCFNIYCSINGVEVLLFVSPRHYLKQLEKMWLLCWLTPLLMTPWGCRHLAGFPLDCILKHTVKIKTTPPPPHISPSLIQLWIEWWIKAKQIKFLASTRLIHPPVIIWSRQRVDPSEPRHVDVIFDDHDVSDLKVLVQASSCIGQEHRLHTHQLKDAHGQCDLGGTNRRYYSSS